jgi:hypothetical protein
MIDYSKKNLCSRLWRSSSDGHVAKEEDEDCELDNAIYSEVLDLPESPEDVTDCSQNEMTFIKPGQVINLSNSCSDLSNKCLFSEISNHSENMNSYQSATDPFANLENILMIDSDIDCRILSSRHSWDTEFDTKVENNESESFYVPMRKVSSERHRVFSESGISSFNSNTLNSLSSSTAFSDDSIYVSMNGEDRKGSLSSDIYALVTGVQPEMSSHEA